MTPTTRSSTPPDALLQAINGMQDSLKTITSELKLLKNDLNDVQQVVLTLKTDLNDVQAVIKPFPKTIDDLDIKLNHVHEEATTNLDVLRLQTADLAVELDRLQSLTNDAESPNTTTLTETDIKNITNKTIDRKLQTLPSLIKQELDNNPVIQNLSTSSTTQLHQALLDLHKQPKSHQRTIGFHQPESKDFHVSKLLKLLETHTLTGDSLQDLEIFYDIIISHLATVTLNSNILPTYRQLTPSFRFQEHLCCPNHNTTLSNMDIIQAKANYKSFGHGLRQFIIHPKTITTTTSPDSYLQLLSLKHEPDGFLLLQHFIFLRSPQLEGKFIDYRIQINQLSINNGESIRSFYSRAMWLHNEITLAKLQDGSLTVLLEHFLHLLRSTHCHIILAETSMAWKQIREHRRQPTHINSPPPITLNTILRDIENAGVTTLQTPSTTTNDKPETHLHTPVAYFSDQLHIDPTVAYTNSQKHLYNKQHKNFISTKNQPNFQHTKPNSPTTTPSQNQHKCRLCNNQHPNPWHSTDQCPFKDPTYIQNKLIRENVMQHNTLYGRINKNYNKNMDNPINQNKPPKATIPTTAKVADIFPDPPTLPASDTSDLIDLQNEIYHPIQDLIDSPVLSDTPHENYHLIPTPTANTGSASSNNNLTHDLFEDTSDLLFDPTNYLHFTS